jgi:pimeloyl-ACP methyl ester carboxylesterase
LKRLQIALLALLLLVAATPAATAAPPRPTLPVIFIPGLAGSQLYNDNELVWLNLGHEAFRRVPVAGLFARPKLQALALKPDGQTPASPRYHIRVGDVPGPGPLGFYTGWLDALGAYGYRRGSTLFVYTWDWRKGVEAAARDLDTVITKALRNNPGGKVVLVGHSMGGLIAREYVVNHGGRRVAGLIAAGTPWLGAPVAWQALRTGHDFGIRMEGTRFKVQLPADMRKLAQNFPSMYELVPGRHYHTLYRGFIWRGGAPLPFDQAVAQELVPRNAALAPRAGFGDHLMTGRDYGVRQYLLAGYGLQTLVGADDGQGKWKERYGEGDEFVPLASADLGANFNVASPRRFLGAVQEVAYVRGSHNWLMGHPRAQRQIRDWLRAIERGAPLHHARPVTRWHR